MRFVTPELAILHSVGGFLRPGETELSAERRGVQSIVAVKDGGVCPMTSFQVTRVSPSSPSGR